jgi:ABC-type transport system substrate-binding protein
MSISRRELLEGATAAAVVGALAPSAQAQTTQKKELVTAQGGDIAPFDPHFSTSSNDIRVSFTLRQPHEPPSYEDYGLPKYVEWTPNPIQQFEVRRFNLKLRRA